MVAPGSLWQDYSSHTLDSEYVSEYVSDEDAVEDLTDLMHHWWTREALVFREQVPSRKDGTTEDDSESSEIIDRQTRNRVVNTLHVLLSSCNAKDDSPMALTLFDAISLRQPRLFASSLTSIAALVALVRITVLTSSKASEQELFQAEMLAEEMQTEGEETVTAKQTMLAELDLINAMDGRIKLPSPTEWAQKMVDYLLAIGAPRESLQAALPGIIRWAEHLIYQGAATPALPPQKLGLIACMLGLLNAGLLKAEDLRPPNLSDEDWENSLIMQLGNAYDAGPDLQQSQKDTINIKLFSRLPRVFNCSSGKLCQMTLDFSNLLRAHFGMDQGIAQRP